MLVRDILILEIQTHLAELLSCSVRGILETKKQILKSPTNIWLVMHNLNAQRLVK